MLVTKDPRPEPRRSRFSTSSNLTSVEHEIGGLHANRSEACTLETARGTMWTIQKKRLKGNNLTICPICPKTPYSTVTAKQHKMIQYRK
jgi:hypothetical protein